MEFTNIGLLVLVLVVYETAGNIFKLPTISTCYKDSDCDPQNCCAKKIGPIIMSRAVHTTVDPETIKGRCQPYVQQGGWCGGIWRRNGQCGCAPSLTCHWYPPHTPNFPTLGKRKLMVGDYFCEPR